MQDRVKLSNGKSSKLMCPSTYAPADFATFLSDLQAGNVFVDVTPNNSLDTDAGVTVVGTALNKANLLTDATATLYGLDNTTGTPNEALAKLATFTTATLTAGATSVTINNEDVTSTSHIDFYFNPATVVPTGVTQTTGAVTLTFDAQSADVSISMRVL